jgi:ATP:cob(I)alamin adenosyltransferase
MVITTKKGDFGKTTLYGHSIVYKDHSIIKLLSKLDYIQVLIGKVKITIDNKNIKTSLEQIQIYIYKIMTYIADKNKSAENEVFTKFLKFVEKEQNKLLKITLITNKFVIPGANQKEIEAHIVRTTIRIFETELVTLSKKNSKYKPLLPFFNRLSDYFFILSQLLIDHDK